ncbi:hypothetical protein EVJ58_g10555, partial [Rhodofomes roseus]
MGSRRNASVLPRASKRNEGRAHGTSDVSSSEAKSSDSSDSSDSTSDHSSDEEEARPSSKKARSKKAASKKAPSKKSSDDSSDEEEAKPSSKKARSKEAASKKSSSKKASSKKESSNNASSKTGALQPAEADTGQKTVRGPRTNWRQMGLEPLMKSHLKMWNACGGDPGRRNEVIEKLVTEIEGSGKWAPKKPTNIRYVTRRWFKNHKKPSDAAEVSDSDDEDNVDRVNIFGKTLLSKGRAKGASERWA